MRGPRRTGAHHRQRPACGGEQFAERRCRDESAVVSALRGLHVVMLGGMEHPIGEHATIEELAAHSRCPVINGLTDLLHPCQVLADVLTVREEFGSWEGKVVAWIGYGNNMANSWIEAAGMLGFELRLACPEGYEPNHAIYEQNASKTRLSITELPEEAAAGAHVVTTDVWASMGHEQEAESRRHAFRGYAVDDALMALARPEAIFLHCLPAHRGEEVADSVLEGPRSRVWPEAENRLHIQKALMTALMSGTH